MNFNLNLILNDAPQPWQIGFQDSAAPGFSGVVELHNTLFFYLIVVVVGVFFIFNYFNLNFWNESFALNSYEESNFVRGSNILKSEFDSWGHTSRDNNNQEVAAINIAEVITELNSNKPSLNLNKTQRLLGDLTESICVYYKAGGSPENLSIYSRIINKRYFLIIQEGVFETTGITLPIPLDADNSTNVEPGNPNAGSFSNNGGELSNSNNSNPNSNLEYNLLDRILLFILSLFSYAMDIFIELLNNFY